MQLKQLDKASLHFSTALEILENKNFNWGLDFPNFDFNSNKVNILVN